MTSALTRSARHARIAELTALRGQLTDLLAQAESYRPSKETA